MINSNFSCAKRSIYQHRLMKDEETRPDSVLSCAEACGPRQMGSLGNFVQVRKQLVFPRFMLYMISLYQDKLGTNIGKSNSTNRLLFSVQSDSRPRICRVDDAHGSLVGKAGAQNAATSFAPRMDRKTSLLCNLHFKTIILPRQAGDKHGESWEAGVLGSSMSMRRCKLISSRRRPRCERCISFCVILYWKRSFCQDRLGTNIPGREKSF